MRMGLRRSVGMLLVGLLLLLAACDEVPTESSPAPSQSESVVNVPTRTVKPIVSFTPRFTATPIPSITLTPSDTPTVTLTTVPPTHTPTPSPTFTPTVQGEIQSLQNVNLREGPGEDFPIVISLPPGTDVGVIGIQTDDQGRDWYKVVYTNDNGETMRLWVFSTLVQTDFEQVVAPPTPTLPAPPNATASPRTPGVTPEPNRIDILAYCRQKNLIPPNPTTNDNVYVEWSWFVALPELMDQHLEHADYNVRLDDEPLENWNTYATEMQRESGVWIIYWYYPVGKLAAGPHEISFELTWSEAISDGYEPFGPGTANETDTGSCTFTVIEP
ncbi:MAG: SH3 domain-containing protein [Anaerolineae bacterium]|nr:SH3 domain-containing protein [Anaerolineae bacterium]